MRVVRRSQGAIREGSNRNMVLGVQRGTLRRYVLWWKGYSMNAGRFSRERQHLLGRCSVVRWG